MVGSSVSECNKEKFIFGLAKGGHYTYNTKADRWKRGIAKNEVQFELASYMPKYYDEVFTNDIEYFKNEYKKLFKKELEC